MELNLTVKIKKRNKPVRMKIKDLNKIKNILIKQKQTIWY